MALIQTQTTRQSWTQLASAITGAVIGALSAFRFAFSVAEAASEHPDVLQGTQRAAAVLRSLGGRVAPLASSPRSKGSGDESKRTLADAVVMISPSIGATERSGVGPVAGTHGAQAR